MKHFIYSTSSGNNVFGIADDEDTVKKMVPSGTAFYYFTLEDLDNYGSPDYWTLSGTPDGYGTREE